jgi:hypothetical protein
VTVCGGPVPQMVLGHLVESEGAERELQCFNRADTRQFLMLGLQTSGWRLFCEKALVKTLGGHSVFIFLT